MAKGDRCPRYSMAWNVQCELKEGHTGMCVNHGDGFYGQIPSEPPPEQSVSKPEKALRRQHQRFENRLRAHLPTRNSFEGRKLSEEEKEEIAISEVRKELMEGVAYALDISSASVGGVAAELVLFESWVKARKT